MLLDLLPLFAEEPVVIPPSPPGGAVYRPSPLKPPPPKPAPVHSRAVLDVPVAFIGTPRLVRVTAATAITELTSEGSPRRVAGTATTTTRRILTYSNTQRRYPPGYEDDLIILIGGWL